MPLTRTRAWIGVAVAGAAALQWLLPSAAAWQAPARLVVAVMAIAFVPGYAVSRALGWFEGAALRERIPLWFAAGFAVMAPLQVIAILLHLSIAQAFALLAAATIAALLLPSTAATTSSMRLSWLTGLILLALIACGWVLEASITGEETVELISIRKIAENPFISIDGIMPEPHVVPTYVITPYYFFVAMVTKAAGVSLLVAYVKLRALYVALAVLTLSALGARLFPQYGESLADAVVSAFFALFVVDPDPWTWPASMFPLLRRGAFSAGVLAPAMMLAMLVAVADQGRRTAGQWLLGGLLLLAVLTTHALEIIYVGFFGIGVAATAALMRRSGWSPARLVMFGGSAAAVAIVYRLVHPRLAAHVYAFDQASRAQALAGLRAELERGWSSFNGISDAGSYLVSTSGAVIPFTLLGLLCVPWLVRLGPGGVLMWASAAIPLAVYGSSKLFALLQLATSSEILFVFAYFTLWGVLGLSIAGYTLVEATLRTSWLQRIARPGAPSAVVLPIVAGVSGYAAALALRPIVSQIVAHPLIYLWVLLISGVIAIVTWRSRTPQEPSTHGWTAIVLATLVMGIALGFRGFPGRIEGSLREPLAQTIARARQTPSVLDETAYYPVLQTHANPPIDLPLNVVEDLDRLLPPLQSIAADPAHSFSLPVVLNQHIVNPGHVISTSLPYFERYARLDDKGIRHHPVFNDAARLTADDRAFLDEYKVQYIVVNPANRRRVAGKLDAEPRRFERIYDKEGFSVYRCLGSGREGQ